MDVLPIIIAVVIAPLMWIIIKWILNHTILVDDQTTSHITAAIAVVIILAAAVLWSTFNRKPQAEEPPGPQAYIDSHKDEDEVLRTITINGRYADFSEDDALWVYVHPSVSDLYYLSEAYMFNDGT